MRVRLIHQRSGDFDLTLNNPTRTIIDELEHALGSSGDPDTWTPRDGYLVITDTAYPTPDMSLSVGKIPPLILTKRTGPASFTGRTIEYLLGTRDRPGPFRWGAPSAQAAANMAQLATHGVPTPFTSNVTEPGGTIDYVRHTAQSRAEILDYGVDLFTSCSWKVDPDLTIQMGPDANVVQTTPQVVIGPASVTDFASGNRLRGIRGTVTRELDSEQLTYYGVAWGVANATPPGYMRREATSSRQTMRDPVNGTDLQPQKLVDSPQAATTTELDATAQAVVNLFQSPRQSFTVTTPAASRIDVYVDRGDRVYMYDPANGVYDNTNHNQDAGFDMFPIEATVIEIEYYLASTAGVTLMRHDGTNQNWTDLTPWVAFPQQQSTLKVSTSKGALNRSGGKPVRFHPEIAARIDS